MSALHTVYGARGPAINRRTAIAGLAAVPIRPRGGEGTVARAERAIGGRALIDRVRAIRWTGEAELAMPGRTLVLRVETRVEPFSRARSVSWVKAQGRASARTMEIEPDAAFVLREGARQPMPPAQAAHERQQFGLYGHLLLKGALQPAAAMLLSTRPGFPPARLRLSADGRVVAAEMTVSDPGEAARTIREQVGLDAWSVTRGLVWPRRLAMRQDGRRYFTLVIDTFDVELA